MHFFIGLLKIEIKQLNCVDAYEMCQAEARQATAVKKVQGINPGDRTHKLCVQNFNAVENKDKQVQ